MHTQHKNLYWILATCSRSMPKETQTMKKPTSPRYCEIVIDGGRRLAVEIAEAQIRKWTRHFNGRELTLRPGHDRIATSDLGELFELPRGNPHRLTQEAFRSAFLLARGNSHAWAKDEHWYELIALDRVLRNSGPKHMLSLGLIEAFALSQREKGILSPVLNKGSLEHRTDNGRIGWSINKNGDTQIIVYAHIGAKDNAVGVPMMKFIIPYSLVRQHIGYAEDCWNEVFPAEIQVDRLNIIRALPLGMRHAVAVRQQINHLIQKPIRLIDFCDQFAKFLTSDEANPFYTARMRPV